MIHPLISWQPGFHQITIQTDEGEQTITSTDVSNGSFTLMVDDSQRVVDTTPATTFILSHPGDIENMRFTLGFWVD